MLDYRFAVMLNEERVRDWRRERSLRAQLPQARRLPEPRPEGRRRWSFAALIGRLSPDHGAR